MDTRENRAHESPAADAAGLLLRIGFGLLVLAAPVSAIYSRRAFVVLVPIGALLIVGAGLVRDSADLLRHARAAVLSPIGGLLLLFSLWLLLSLIWTPFPGPAGERALRTVGNLLMAVMVAHALPERMRASNLHLMTIGVAAATLALSLSALVGPYAFRALHNPETPTLGRAAVAASVMVWPAVAWTHLRNRVWHGLALVVVCALAVAASGSPDALVTLVVALAVYLAAQRWPMASGRGLAFLAAGIVLFAPLLALAARALVTTTILADRSLLAQAASWAPDLLQEPLRLLTGHGFDTSHRASKAGLVGQQAQDGLLQMLWFDLGLPGALLCAMVLFFTFRTLAERPRPLAPAAMTVLATSFVVAMIDPSATQAWWLSVCVVTAVMLSAVARGQYRTARPAANVVAPALRPAEPAAG
ncbi:MAG TPA: hypothetical protein PLQ11_01780 [Beijerinckiaceae bacterium]|nr:hypothetical protein [Beijerinckiaceae bacterium]